MISFPVADLFCGAGGTSTGAVEAIEALGYKPVLTVANHWPRAIATHEANHPDARHFCACLDSLNPRELFKPRELKLLWASPECTMHSTGRNKALPMRDQSRTTAHCVTRWMEALLPEVVLVENVPPFKNWGPLSALGLPLKKRRGETFNAWIGMMKALGYRVDYQVLCAENYGDPTSRERLFVQAVRGRREIVWPNPTHGPGLLPVATARQIIDFSIPIQRIRDRKRPLSPKTMSRIDKGLKKFGGAVIVAMEHGGRLVSIDQPLPTVTCAKGGAFGLAYILPQGGGGQLRSVDLPAPTVTTDGALALVIEYYGNGRAHSIDKPLPTVTCRDRFALIQRYRGDVYFRMLKPNELAGAQGFRRDYIFTGTVQEQTKQIGNAVPRRLARAIVAAAVSQNPDVSYLVNKEKSLA